MSNQFLHPWTEEQLQFLRDNYLDRNTNEIAKFLNRTPEAVRHRARREGLRRTTDRVNEDGLVLCLRCKEHKEADEFYKNKSSKIGLYSLCKPCASISQKEKAYHKKVEKELKLKEKFLEANKDKLHPCSNCREELPLDAFSIWRRPGTEYYEKRAYCTPCSTELNKKRLLEKERKNEYVKFTPKP